MAQDDAYRIDQAEVLDARDVWADSKTVFRTDFTSGMPAAFSGVKTTDSVQGYAGLGTGANVFGGRFLRNQTAGRTVLTLADLPTHASIDLNFLFAAIDSWDNGEYGGHHGPDYFNVLVDGKSVFVENFSYQPDQGYVPPPGVELRRSAELGFNSVWRDSAYDLGLDPKFDAIPHTAETLQIEWFASGDAWEGGQDESWAIDNVEVILNGLLPGVLANDTDADGDLRAVLVDGPSHGTLSFGDYGSFQYAPQTSFHGTDRFTYLASDGQANSNLATVSITVDPITAAPLAATDRYTVVGNGVLNVAAASGLLANDTDRHPDRLTAVAVSLPTHGSLILSANGGFSYIPDIGFAGTDSFFYRADNRFLESEAAEVVITVGFRPFAGLTPVEWPVSEGGNGHVYALVNSRLTWRAANEAALTHLVGNSRGHLATITSSAESTWIKARFPGIDFWLGGFQDYESPSYSEPSGGWTWVTGEPWAFVDWAVGEPNNESGEGFLLLSDTLGDRWNDERHQQPAYLVEFDPGGALSAADDLWRVPAETPLVRDAASGVLANDMISVQGQPAVALLTGPLHGDLTLNADGSFTYVPAAGFAGRDSFTYRVAASGRQSNLATAWLKVGLDDFAPTTTDDTYAIRKDTSLEVVGTAADLGGARVFFTDFSAGAPAEFSGVTNTESVQGFAGLGPGANVFGDLFLRNNVRPAEPTTLTLTNLPPHTSIDLKFLLAILDTWDSTDYLTVVVDGKTVFVESFPLLGEPSPRYNAPPGVQLLAKPVNLGFASSGESAWNLGLDPRLSHISHTANTLTVEWVASKNWEGGSNESWAIDNVEVVVHQTLPGVLANDIDPEGDSLTAALLDGPAHGTLVFHANGNFTYTPDAGYVGLDTFTYTASDGTLGSEPATVTIAVAPTAVDDQYALDEDGSLEIKTLEGVLANDLDGGLVTAELVDRPAHGELTFNADGSFTYRPALNYYGGDTFTYRAWDGAEYSRTATVSLTVRPVNDRPTAAVNSYKTDEDRTLSVDAAQGVLANDNDVEGDALDAVLVRPPSHGTVELDKAGSFVYVPAPNFYGTDFFQYKANDGSVDSNIATVTILVASVNDPPVAADESYVTPEDQSLTVSSPGGVLVNDSDVEKSPLTAVLVDPPGHGTLTLSPQGWFVYLPAPDFSGTDRFTYRASDGAAQSSLATVTLTVTPVNDVPVADDDVYRLGPNRTLSVPVAAGLLVNDFDADGDPLTAALVSGPAHGTLNLASSGAFVYTPEAGFTGADTFTYRVGDGTLDSNLASVTIVYDDAAPSVVGAGINGGSPQRSLITSLAIRFSEDVLASLDGSDLAIRNDTTGATLDLTDVLPRYDHATNAAVWNLAGVQLADGRYTATLAANGVADAAGNRLAGGDFVFQFFRLAGDADGNGAVDIFDVAVLQRNYGRSGSVTPADGDFSGDGEVNIIDVALLQLQYGKTLDETQAAPAEMPSPAVRDDAASTAMHREAVGRLVSASSRPSWMGTRRRVAGHARPQTTWQSEVDRIMELSDNDPVEAGPSSLARLR
ncbi:MAG: Ig-like domain-containing protein [Pirellulales bacterium]